MKFFDLMSRACEDVGLELTEEKFNKFMMYKDLIQEWNKQINLTAIVEDDDIIKKHFIDCIKAFKLDEFKNAKSIIDVGTGAGFPGIPLAIMNEDVKITLLDSLNKRVNFLNIVVNKLNLNNVTTIHSRAEDGARNSELREKFDIATSRAVANMSILSELCIPYVKNNGNFIALKGPSIEDELEGARNALKVLGAKLIDVIEVEVEDTDLKHNLVLVKKIKSTPNTYPRKAGTINKKPIV